MEAHFEIFKGSDGGWYWHLKSANGEIVAISESYINEAHVERGIHDMVDTVHEATDLSISADKVITKG